MKILRAIALNSITFYRHFEANILARSKTITIRDESESYCNQRLHALPFNH